MAAKSKADRDWARLNERIVACERCPRLRTYCQQVAVERRAAFRDWDYWGKPAPNFGDPQARLLIVGLAPAAHGANRTGRMFTGDRSGDFLYRALYKAGFANQPTSVSVDDGLRLVDCAITATCHCAPPDNKPLPEEVANCQGWFDETLDMLPVRVLFALGQIGWRSIFSQAKRRGWHSGPLPKFGHGATATLGAGEFGSRMVVASYHPSQQNTFTGKLTEAMLDDVLVKIRRMLDAR